MSVKKIYFDESGNTEAGLHDSSQLFITFASVLSTDEICKLALKQAFPDNIHNEIKYTNVKDDCGKVIEALSFVKDNGGSFKIYLVYKPL